MTETLLGPLVPPDLSPLSVAVLLVVNFITSAFTATVGLGGGVAILAVLANLLPVAAIIPIHAVVQLSNNSSRTILNRSHVLWKLVGWFTLGALAGGVVAASVVVTLPRPVLQLALGVFVLYSVFGPKPTKLSFGRTGTVIGGALTTFATFFVGATGPLVAAILPYRDMSKHEVVATHGACMVLQHLLKIVFFGLLGFAFLPWAGFLVAMLVTGFFGSYLGRFMLGRIPEQKFVFVFRAVILLLAVRLVYSGAVELLG